MSADATAVMSFDFCLCISMISGVVTVPAGNEGARMSVGELSPTVAAVPVGQGLARIAKSGIRH